MWMIFDSNKRFVAAGDAFPSSVRTSSVSIHCLLVCYDNVLSSLPSVGRSLAIFEYMRKYCWCKKACKAIPTHHQNYTEVPGDVLGVLRLIMIAGASLMYDLFF